TLPAAIDSGRAGELRRDADGKSPGELELHSIARVVGILRAAMRPENDGNVEAFPRKNKGSTTGRSDLRRGLSGQSTLYRKNRGAFWRVVLANGRAKKILRRHAKDNTGRYRNCDFLEWFDRRAQRRHPFALQHCSECNAASASLHATQGRPHPRH